MNLNVLILSALFLLKNDVKDATFPPDESDVTDIQDVASDVQESTESPIPSDATILTIETNLPIDALAESVTELKTKPADRWVMSAPLVLLPLPQEPSPFDGMDPILTPREELAFRRALKRAHDRTKTMPNNGSRRKRK